MIIVEVSVIPSILATKSHIPVTKSHYLESQHTSKRKVLNNICSIQVDSDQCLIISQFKPNQF